MFIFNKLFKFLEELKNLLLVYPIYSAGDNPQKMSTFAAVLKEYPEKFEKRTYGKAKVVQSRIKPVI